MNILADENMDARIIAWLREAGADVLSVIESMRGEEDGAILARANAEHRVVLTKDMDFGEMIYADRLPAMGVILLRLDASTSAERLSILQQRWAEVAKYATGNFVVVTRERMRIRPIPSQPA